MMPLIIAIPMAAFFLLFFVAFAAVGASLILGAVGYLLRSVLDRDYGSMIGVITLGFIIAMFGWVIMVGSYDAGSVIIDGLITRLRQ